jgi:hypothetical protein
MKMIDGLVVVFERNQFYRRQYLLALSAFGLMLAVIGVLIYILIYLTRHPVHPLYFATDNVGRLISVVPASQPNMTNEEVVAWTIAAVQAAYSYDYVNYHSQLQDAQKYFTAYGWGKFMGALTASNNLVALKERKMIVSAAVVDKPTLVTEGILGGSYAWKFKMPLLATFWVPPYDDKSRFSNALEVSVIVQRQPVFQSNKGLGIVQIIASEAAPVNSAPQDISSTSTG